MFNSTCSTHNVAFVSLPCPANNVGCGVAHFGCPECRAISCVFCGKKIQPEQQFHLCLECVERALVWAAKESYHS